MLVLLVSLTKIENCRIPPVTGFAVLIGLKVLKSSIGPAMQTRITTRRVNPMAIFFKTGYLAPSSCCM